MSAGGKNASPQARANGKRPAEGPDRHEGPKKGHVEDLRQRKS
jgi:hypothetical protein